MKTILKREEFAHINLSPQFFVYARNWWDGASIDLLGLYINEENKVIKQKWIAGESTEPKDAILSSESEVEISELQYLVSDFNSLELDYSQKIRFYMHYDVIIGVKKEGIEHWILLSGGDSDNTRISQFADTLYEHLPIKSDAE